MDGLDRWFALCTIFSDLDSERLMDVWKLYNEILAERPDWKFSEIVHDLTSMEF